MGKLKSNVKMEGGFMKQLSHWSEANQCEMTFSVFLPTPASRTAPPPPTLYYLSGLTCTDESARTKAHFAAEAAKLGLAVVFPDTSARPEVAIEGQDESYDFGSGAGFYVDATTEKWKKHYNMGTYITKELPELISGLFPVDPEKRSITGHSMGGHGALVCHLKNPGMYSSVSAFSPICNPTVVPWGEKAFTGYLGSVEAGKAYDATELVSSYSGPKVPVLIDQGTAEAKELLSGGRQEQLQRGAEDAAPLRPLLLLHLHLHARPHRLPRPRSGAEAEALNCTSQ